MAWVKPCCRSGSGLHCSILTLNLNFYPGLLGIAERGVGLPNISWEVSPAKEKKCGLEFGSMSKLRNLNFFSDTNNFLSYQMMLMGYSWFWPLELYLAALKSYVDVWGLNLDDHVQGKCNFTLSIWPYLSLSIFLGLLSALSELMCSDRHSVCYIIENEEMFHHRFLVINFLATKISWLVLITLTENESIQVCASER